MHGQDIRERLGRIAADVKHRFDEEQRILSFDEYLALLVEHPLRHCRDAARYVRDAFDYFGTTEVERPWGRQRRFRLFDQEFLRPEDARSHALVAQEHVQEEIYRVLSNFVREGRPNRLLLLHGPNGSAKSTVTACLMRALEHYSTVPEGALYRFHWVFPSKASVRGSIGFSGRAAERDVHSYAHLPDDELDARLFIEVRDHPLLLIPDEERRSLLQHLFEGEEEPPPAWVLQGGLSMKSRQIYDALMSSYDGDLSEVLRHVQVERYFVSRRYRVGAVTIGPQLAVDASERQVTSDRSLASLPASLQSLSLFEAYGELVDASGGVLEFSDLLKRPLDAFKYLQTTAESGEVALKTQALHTNCVFMASGNEVHLTAFREHPEFQSFRGRLELIQTPYLLSYLDEQRIYDFQIAPRAQRHVAPHATRMAALFAVLTRMRKPSADRYPEEVRSLVRELSATDKLELYATARAPARLDEDARQRLRAVVGELHREGQSYPVYEGSVGASPREMRTVLLDAAQSPHYACLSPFAVLAELERLCARKSEYAWLEEERQPGGYHDFGHFLEWISRELHDTLEAEFRSATGLVDETRYSELFDRYITHVSNWVKREKVRNPITGGYEDPDERLMREVEALLGGAGDPDQLRHSLISRVAAWAIDHPGRPVDNERVFADQLARMRDSVFADRRAAVAHVTQSLLVLLRDEGSGLDREQKSEARSMLEQLRERYGYEASSAADAAAALLRERFAGLV